MRHLLKKLGLSLAGSIALGFVSGCCTHWQPSAGDNATGPAATAALATPTAPVASRSATCYLFAYFYHAEEAEGFRLAWSSDGYHFEKLNDGKSYLKPTAGENR